MVLNHLAAMFFFAGPLFYAGLWMVLDPAVVVRLLEPLARAYHAGRRSPVESARTFSIRTAVRCAGAVLLLFALAV